MHKGDQDKQHTGSGGGRTALDLQENFPMRSETEASKEFKPPEQGILLFHVTALMSAKVLWGQMLYVVTSADSIQDTIETLMIKHTNHLHLSFTVFSLDHFFALHFTSRSYGVFETHLWCKK